MKRIIREESLLRENYLIKYYGKSNWSTYVKKYIKVLIDTLLMKMTNEVPKSIMIHTAVTQKSVAAFVKIDQRAIDTSVFHVYVRDSFDFNRIAINLAHELVHVMQILEGDLSANRNGIVWKGQDYDAEAYRKATSRGKRDSQDAYWNAPWEIEARELEEKYYTEWLRSRERKTLVKQLGTELHKYSMDEIIAKHTPEDLQDGVPVKVLNDFFIASEESLVAEKKFKKIFLDKIQSGEAEAGALQKEVERNGGLFGFTRSGSKRMIDWLEQFIDYDGAFDDF